MQNLNSFKPFLLQICFFLFYHLSYSSPSVCPPHLCDNTKIIRIWNCIHEESQGCRKGESIFLWLSLFLPLLVQCPGPPCSEGGLCILSYVDSSRHQSFPLHLSHHLLIYSSSSPLRRDVMMLSYEPSLDRNIWIFYC